MPEIYFQYLDANGAKAGGHVYAAPEPYTEDDLRALAAKHTTLLPMGWTVLQVAKLEDIAYDK